MKAKSMQPLVLIAALVTAAPAAAMELGRLLAGAAWAGALVPNPWQRLEPRELCPDVAAATRATLPPGPTPVPSPAATVEGAPVGAATPAAVGTRPLDWRALLPGALR
jgi:hypothetical protein